VQAIDEAIERSEVLGNGRRILLGCRWRDRTSQIDDAIRIA
jgi:hypothetical protein